MSGGGSRTPDTKDKDEVTLKREDDRDEPTLAEKVSIGASVLITLLLFGYVVFQGATAPEDGFPEAKVVGIEPQENDVRVMVMLTNPANGGYDSVTVSLDCDTPPPEVTITNVPAGAEYRFVVMCPPGTTIVNATIDSVLPV